MKFYFDDGSYMIHRSSADPDFTGFIIDYYTADDKYIGYYAEEMSGAVYYDIPDSDELECELECDALDDLRCM